METKVLGVAAFIDLVDDESWCARVFGQEGPFTGLFAFGPSFVAARQALAGVVAEAIASGTEGVGPGEFDHVRIFAVTRKTFPLDEASS